MLTVIKNPSDATNKRNSELCNLTNIGSRKHAVFCHPLSIRPPVAAEGRFKVLLRFMLQIATLSPTCQYPEPLDYRAVRHGI